MLSISISSSTIKGTWRSGNHCLRTDKLLFKYGEIRKAYLLVIDFTHIAKMCLQLQRVKTCCLIHLIKLTSSIKRQKFQLIGFTFSLNQECPTLKHLIIIVQQRRTKTSDPHFVKYFFVTLTDWLVENSLKESARFVNSHQICLIRQVSN